MHHSLIKVNSDTQIKAMKNVAKREEHSEPDRASLAALVSGGFVSSMFLDMPSYNAWLPPGVYVRRYFNKRLA